MNRQEKDILIKLFEKTYISRRVISEVTGYKLGTVDKALKSLKAEGYLTDSIQLTEKAQNVIRDSSPINAIILAAGFGMRMVPINTEIPKGLIEIKGEPLIERLIKQLHESGIYDISIVVGFKKEQYEYLIDDYEVELVVNNEYSVKNNLHSLSLVKDKISNTYIIPCDVWSKYNPFNRCELYSWYMVGGNDDFDSNVYVSRRNSIIKMDDNRPGNSMIGISYLIEDQAKIVRENIDRYECDKKYDNSFWEEVLFDRTRMIAYARIVSNEDVVEINTYEQLRELDSNSNHLKSDAIDVITSVFNIRKNEIENITVLKKGMTNRSFLFTVNGRKYIMRIPGEGTDQLINRKDEAEVYDVLRCEKISDEVIYIDPNNGYKISVFVEKSRVCNPYNKKDVELCISNMRTFHERSLKVEHEFNIWEQIDFYEKLCDGKPSSYRDYELTKKHVFDLKEYIDSHLCKKALTHIDAVSDNFLFDEKGDVIIIDWEYAGMQDPHIDIAMFGIYALYNKQQMDELINIYFDNDCPDEIRIKIYCYIAVCGLLWSNWCEYKESLGVEFGEYSIRQYRYAKEYYKIAWEAIHNGA